MRPWRKIKQVSRLGAVQGQEGLSEEEGSQEKGPEDGESFQAEGAPHTQTQRQRGEAVPVGAGRRSDSGQPRAWSWQVPTRDKRCGLQVGVRTREDSKVMFSIWG